MVSGGESGCLALLHNVLQVLDLLLLVRVPYCRGIFKDRPHIGSIGLRPDISLAAPQVAPQEAIRPVGFGSCLVDMVSP